MSLPPLGQSAADFGGKDWIDTSVETVRFNDNQMVRISYAPKCEGKLHGSDVKRKLHESDVNRKTNVYHNFCCLLKEFETGKVLCLGGCFPHLGYYNKYYTRTFHIDTIRKRLILNVLVNCDYWESRHIIELVTGDKFTFAPRAHVMFSHWLKQRKVLVCFEF